MTIPFAVRLALPLIGAPMFIASYPELVIAQCRAGVLGTFPSLNARSVETLDAWLTEIGAATAAPAAPFGVNLILHKSNTRLMDDLALVVKHRAPLVITSVGKPDRVVDEVHALRRPRVPRRHLRRARRRPARNPGRGDAPCSARRDPAGPRPPPPGDLGARGPP